MPTVADALLWIPTAVTLFCFGRFFYDQQIIWRTLEELRKLFPREVERLGDPVSFSAWNWMEASTEDMFAGSEAAKSMFRDIRRRLRLWNGKMMPLMIVLWVAVGTLRWFLQR